MSNLTILRDQYGWPLRHDAIKMLLGLGSKLPREGVPGRMLKGAYVWVEPAPAPVYRTTYRGTHAVHVATHRVMCKCPECGATVSAGRLAQHKCPPPTSFVDFDGVTVGIGESQEDREERSSALMAQIRRNGHPF